MNERELLALIEKKMGELQALVAKPDLDDTDLSNAESLRDEIAGLRQQVQAGRDRAQRQAKLLGDVRSAQEWLGTGRRQVPFATDAPPSGGGDRGEDGRARIIGYAPAGTMKLWEDERVIEAVQNGYGLITPEKFQKLCSKEYREAFVAYLRCKGNDRRLSDSQSLVLQEGIDEQGGYLVPPDWVAQLVRREPTPTEINSQVFQWDTIRDRVIFPKVRYNGNVDDDPNATLYSTGVRVTYPGETAEDEDAIDSPEPGFGEIEIPVHTAMGALPVTNNQLEDSPFALMQFLMDAFSETVGLEYDFRILRGNGIGKAAGMLRNPSASATADEPQYVVSGEAAALTADGIQNLIFSVAPQYLMNSRFVMSWMSAAKEISNIRDGEGRYLWSSGPQDSGLSESLLGRRLRGFPVSYSEFMPAVAANSFPILFGNLRGYLLARRLGMTVQVLRETRAKRNQVELVIRFRFGGKVWKPWMLKAQKVAAA